MNFTDTIVYVPDVAASLAFFDRAVAAGAHGQTLGPGHGLCARPGRLSRRALHGHGLRPGDR